MGCGARQLRSSALVGVDLRSLAEISIWSTTAMVSGLTCNVDRVRQASRLLETEGAASDCAVADRTDTYTLEALVERFRGGH